MYNGDGEGMGINGARIGTNAAGTGFLGEGWGWG